MASTIRVLGLSFVWLTNVLPQRRHEIGDADVAFMAGSALSHIGAGNICSPREQYSVSLRTLRGCAGAHRRNPYLGDSHVAASSATCSSG